MSLLSHIYRSLSSAIKPSARASSLSTSTSATATVSSSSLAQRPVGMSPVKDFVDNEIEGNKIVVFSKTFCHFCKATKDYFRTEYPEETVKIIELDTRPDESAIQDYLKEKTGARSVPRIFINRVSVGGNSDLQKKTKVELDKMLAVQGI